MGEAKRWMAKGIAPWVALGLAVGAFGCSGDDVEPANDAGLDAGVDAGRMRRDAGPVHLPPAASPAPYRGPWALQGETDRMVVRWETFGEAPVTAAVIVTSEEGGAESRHVGESVPSEIDFTFGTTSVLVMLPDFAGTYYMNEVVVTDLEPATCYRYTVEGYEEHGGRFCTMHEADDHTTPISFLWLADTSPLLEAGEAVLDAVIESNPEFVVHGGDLQYYSALFESWNLWFQDMAPMLEVGAFYPCIGNHEQERDGEYEATYARFFAQPSRDGTTSQYHYETGGVHFFSINSEDDIGEYDDDFSWLDDALAEAKTQPGYRASIVYFHRPIYTLAKHAPSLPLRSVLQPIFEAHDVDLVLQGHNHSYERFEVNGITYLVAGGGGSVLRDESASVDAFPDELPLRQAAGRFHHGVIVTIDADGIHGEAIDTEGVSRDSFNIALGDDEG